MLRCPKHGPQASGHVFGSVTLCNECTKEALRGLDVLPLEETPHVPYEPEPLVWLDLGVVRVVDKMNGEMVVQERDGDAWLFSGRYDQACDDRALDRAKAHAEMLALRHNRRPDLRNSTS
jgi:hypothetical protein